MRKVGREGGSQPLIPAPTRLQADPLLLISIGLSLRKGGKVGSVRGS